MDILSFLPVRVMYEFAKEYSIDVYLVGGAVRDMLLGVLPKDFDFTAIIEENRHKVLSEYLNERFGGSMEYNCYYHTAKFKLKEMEADFVMGRKELYSGIASKPRVAPANLYEDLKRRDFTINTITISLKEGDFGKIYDPFNGIEDIKDKKIRILHSESFRDDPSRLLRGIRYSSRFGFEFEDKTKDYANEAVKNHYLKFLSPGRVKIEIKSILDENNFNEGIKILKKYGIIEDLISDKSLSCGKDLNYYNESNCDKDLIGDKSLSFNNKLNFNKDLNCDIDLRYNGLFYNGELNYCDIIDDESFLKLDFTQKMSCLFFLNSFETLNKIETYFKQGSRFRRNCIILRGVFEHLEKDDIELYIYIYKNRKHISKDMLKCIYRDKRIKKFIQYGDSIDIDYNAEKFPLNEREDVKTRMMAAKLNQLEV